MGKNEILETLTKFPAAINTFLNRGNDFKWFYLFLRSQRSCQYLPHIGEHKDMLAACPRVVSALKQSRSGTVKRVVPQVRWRILYQSVAVSR